MSLWLGGNETMPWKDTCGCFMARFPVMRQALPQRYTDNRNARVSEMFESDRAVTHGMRMAFQADFISAVYFFSLIGSSALKFARCFFTPSYLFLLAWACSTYGWCKPLLHFCFGSFALEKKKQKNTGYVKLHIGRQLQHYSLAISSEIVSRMRGMFNLFCFFRSPDSLFCRCCDCSKDSTELYAARSL